MKREVKMNKENIIITIIYNIIVILLLNIRYIIYFFKYKIKNYFI